MDRPTYLLRLVSWNASHDIGERGLSWDAVRRVCARLGSAAHVLISSEADLPGDLRPYAYAGDTAQIHHVMGHCAGFFGESATMASECAVLGVPAVYAALTGRGYTDEQERRYGLVKNVRTLDAAALDGAARVAAGLQRRRSARAAPALARRHLRRRRLRGPGDRSPRRARRARRADLLMCGIGGWFASAPRQAQGPQRLQRLLAALKHRGPDGAAQLEVDHVGFAHARLALIDIAGGAQPMWSACRRAVIVFNGEIFNYRELRERVSTQGV